LSRGFWNYFSPWVKIGADCLFPVSWHKKAPTLGEPSVYHFVEAKTRCGQNLGVFQGGE